MTRYRLETTAAYDTTAYHLYDDDRRAHAVLYPALGGNCVEFRTTPDNNPGADAPTDIFMPPDNVSDLRAKSPFHGGQPILFPFPNRVRAGVYTFEGQTYHMEKLMASGRDRGAGQAIHGLVADKAWTVEASEADENGARVRSSLTLDAFPDIFEQYPFACRLTVTYTLRDGQLEMHNEVVNTGAKTLPMGLGIHPWFATVLRPGTTLPGELAHVTKEQRAQARVFVPCDSIWELEKLMPTGKVLPVTEDAATFDLRQPTPLDSHYYDHVFTGVQRGADGWSEGGLRDPETGLEMYVQADEQFREWVLYAPESAPIIALEPYTCTTDAVNLQARGLDAGLIALPAGETWTGVIRFGLRRF